MNSQQINFGFTPNLLGGNNDVVLNEIYYAYRKHAREATKSGIHLAKQKHSSTSVDIACVGDLFSLCSLLKSMNVAAYCRDGPSTNVSMDEDKKVATTYVPKAVLVIDWRSCNATFFEWIRYKQVEFKIRELFAINAITWPVVRFKLREEWTGSRIESFNQRNFGFVIDNCEIASERRLLAKKYFPEDFEEKEEEDSTNSKYVYYAFKQ